MEKSSQIHGFVRFKKDKLSTLYEDLDDALTEKNVQSIWELSKVITRQHFSKDN